ncbi:galactose oxidase [Rhizopogon vinicolor AM-OR11-026]|uniref:Galactose oxidase n=1 Tax=Rhizopogon vinicolor AM-OR11-026 TaxID=1314800 RepID=A0A1B7N191_9AGAM|nr:galactose oxidase [Rhizopogon vinicolor AM-OR11-026]
MSIRWTCLTSLSAKARSSHCASIANKGTLLLYAGEFQPRKPVDGDLHLFDLNSANQQSVEDNAGLWRTLSASLKPEPRVGATTVFEGANLYMWGGRGGVDMAPLDPKQSGIWKAQISQNDVVWERLEAKGDEPSPRSFHASVMANGKLYIHAGCPVAGRLSTLHSYDPQYSEWASCADAPDPGRGGTAIASVKFPTSPSSEEVIIRFGGFAGYQLPTSTPPPVDIYTPSTNSWTTVVPSGDPQQGYPAARSVHGLVPLSTPDGTGVALLYHGERDASSLGHAGAGKFWDDVWALLWREGGLGWKKLIVEGDSTPEGRGWFPSTSYIAPGGNTRVVLSGGLLSSNERSGEVWVGDVQF